MPQNSNHATPATERPKFILLWIAAGAWFPLLANFLLPTSTVDNRFWPAIVIGWATLPIAGISQSLLLLGRVQQAWLWAVAAIAADIAGHMLFIVVFRMAQQAGLPSEAAVVPIASNIAATTISVAVAQAVVIGYWRLGAWQWLALAAIAHLLANGAAIALSWLLLDAMPPAPDANVQLIQSVRYATQVVVQWAVFGGIMGWWLWHRLHALSHGTKTAGFR